MKFLSLFLVTSISCFTAVQAQTMPDTVAKAGEEVELKVGDSMEIGVCKGAYFEHLDYFRKTRWSGDTSAYDTATGEGFYKSFFTTGDFDARELPASFSGRRFAILGMEVLMNKNTDKEMGVLYLRGPDPNSVIWVDFSEALDSGELGLPGYLEK
jgi:hypothetical protein